MIGGVIGVGAAWFLATYLSDAHVRIMVFVIGIVFVLYIWFGRVPAEAEATTRGGRRVLGRVVGHHLDAGAGGARRRSRCSCCPRSSTR